mgnify:CR=1 FL=1|tara:strand:+ start:7499 stop:7675 length:177 start_codon:yes stop_codon:yes gene_type:complete
MDFLIENGSLLMDLAFQVVGVFAVIASLTPNENDNKWIDAILKAFNTIGFNVGKARNA